MALHIPFINNKKMKETFRNSETHMPNHGAILMDGNGRWAQKRGMSRFTSHKEGIVARFLREGFSTRTGRTTMKKKIWWNIR